MTEHRQFWCHRGKQFRGVPGIGAREGPVDRSLFHAIGVQLRSFVVKMRLLEHPRFVNGSFPAAQKRRSIHPSHHVTPGFGVRSGVELRIRGNPTNSEMPQAPYKSGVQIMTTFGTAKTPASIGGANLFNYG